MQQSNDNLAFTPCLSCIELSAILRSSALCNALGPIFRLVAKGFLLDRLNRDFEIEPLSIVSVLEESVVLVVLSAAALHYIHSARQFPFKRPLRLRKPAIHRYFNSFVTHRTFQLVGYLKNIKLSEAFVNR